MVRTGSGGERGGGSWDDRVRVTGLAGMLRSGSVGMVRSRVKVRG